VRLIIFLACTVCVMAAAESQVTDEYRSLIGLTRGARGPYAADAMLRLIPKLEQSHRADLIEEAFEYADGALDLYPSDSRASMDTLDAKYAQAAQLRLDRLSLQVMATRQMLAIDVPRARELYDRIEVGPFPVDCSSLAVYDVRSYYETAATLMNSMSQAERDNNADLLFAQRTVATAKSPWQLDGVVTFIGRARLDVDKTAFVIRLLAAQINEGSVVNVGGYIGLTRRVQALTSLVGRSSEVRATLLPAVRGYVERQGSSARCGMAGVPDVTIRQINRLLCGSGSGDESCPDAVERKHLIPRSVIPWKTTVRLWQKPEAAVLKARWDALMYVESRGPRRKERSDQESNQWRAAFRTFMDSLKSSLIRARDVVGAVERLSLLQRLIPTIPQSEDRLSAIQVYVEALKLLEVEEKKNQLWFMYAKPAMSFIASLDDGERQRAELYIEADPVLKLYQTLNQSKLNKSREMRLQ
jgi:hypothetical protein